MKSIAKKLFCVALVLAFMIPAAAPAFAAGGTKTVYVISKIYTGKKSKDNIRNTFTYNKTGLLREGTFGPAGLSRLEYSYNRKNQLTMFRQSLNQWTTCKYTYDKAGRITKSVCTYNNMETDKVESKGYVSTYKYNKDGTLKSETAKKGKKKITIKYTWNSKGLVTKRVTKDANGTSTETNKYDSKGNLKKSATVSDDYKENHTYTNNYKNGRLIKMVDTSDDSKTTYYFEYKKMTVSKSLADQIKAQQWSLINVNINNAIPRNSYDGM